MGPVYDPAWIQCSMLMSCRAGSGVGTSVDPVWIWKRGVIIQIFMQGSRLAGLASRPPFCLNKHVSYTSYPGRRNVEIVEMKHEYNEYIKLASKSIRDADM